jgi:hypothetical protein
LKSIFSDGGDGGKQEENLEKEDKRENPDKEGWKKAIAWWDEVYGRRREGGLGTERRGNCDVARRDRVEFRGAMCGWGGERRGSSWSPVLWELVVPPATRHMGNATPLVKPHLQGWSNGED